MIRVLIVDDSALMREVLTQILSKDEEIEVVGTAPDPYIAVEKIKRLNPDVLTLDVEMPKMDGLAFLERLMKAHPMPVVMISAWTSSNSEKAIKSLELGAVDFVQKPSTNVQLKAYELTDEIINKVKNAAKCLVKNEKHSLRVYGISDITKNKIDEISKLYKNENKLQIKSDKIILIGASTGGTGALETIISKLPSNMPGIVIVQHMPEHFTKAFADRLNNLYDLKIKEAEDGDHVSQGCVYVAPGGKQCYLKSSISGFSIQVTDDPPVNRLKPSVDALFLSAAKNPCRKIIGVILTGIGKDGAEGLLALKKAGSYNIAQDEASCIVFGMPKEAIELGAADEVVSLNNIANRLIDLIR
jgi:two-component system chemotaxis response regulator CheB